MSLRWGGGAAVLAYRHCIWQQSPHAGFFTPPAKFWWPVKHNRAIGCNSEVHRLGEFVIHLVHTLGVDRRCTHHGMREAVLARHFNFVLQAPPL